MALRTGRRANAGLDETRDLAEISVDLSYAGSVTVDSSRRVSAYEDVAASFAPFLEAQPPADR